MSLITSIDFYDTFAVKILNKTFKLCTTVFILTAIKLCPIPLKNTKCVTDVEIAVFAPRHKLTSYVYKLWPKSFSWTFVCQSFKRRFIAFMSPFNVIERITTSVNNLYSTWSSSYNVDYLSYCQWIFFQKLLF